MKKFLLILTLFCSTVFAQPSDNDFGQWPRSYYASVGFSVIANRGDFFERTVKLVDEDGTVETLHFPMSKFLISPDYNIGVNIREFSLAASFQYWSMNGNINGFADDIKEQKMRYWRFGLEFTYNFFYPDFFQVGVGLGYSFSNLHVENSATSVKGFADSEVMGSGIALVTNLKYFITDNFGLNPSLRVYENWYKAAYTKDAGTQDLKSYLWQTYIAVSINALVQF